MNIETNFRKACDDLCEELCHYAYAPRQSDKSTLKNRFYLNIKKLQPNECELAKIQNQALDIFILTDQTLFYKNSKIRELAQYIEKLATLSVNTNAQGNKTPEYHIRFLDNRTTSNWLILIDPYEPIDENKPLIQGEGHADMLIEPTTTKESKNALFNIRIPFLT